MARLLDLEMRVVRRLDGLPYPAYLCAMYVMGLEVRAAHAVFMSDRVKALTARTLDLVLAASESEAARPPQPAADILMKDWDQLSSDADEDGPGAYLGVLEAFMTLTAELAGHVRRHSASDMITGGVAEYPTREELLAGPRLVQVAGPGTDVDANEDTFNVKMVRNFEAVAALAGEHYGKHGKCDPAQIRAIVFTEPTTPPDLGPPPPEGWL
ncbi:hypothetical protein ABN034_30060 [Actinopolymorpha sp. B11F2]|uniref:hypothetical protein n=1 Tax=Actinopolymorpha sp. B11F2 TaxID=3160862 RepID=UPI0032E3A532